MSNVRELESKYHRIICDHLEKALDFIPKNFISKLSTSFEDSNLSFDLVVESKFVVSVRIRKNKYINYNDMTIRYKSKNNQPTEFDKIKKGHAQIYFYAYESKDQKSFDKVRIVHVDAIRKLITQERYTVRQNPDGTELAAFSFVDIKNFGGALYKYN